MDPVTLGAIGKVLGGLLAGAAIEFVRTWKARREGEAAKVTRNLLIAAVELWAREQYAQGKDLKLFIHELSLKYGIEEALLAPAVEEIVEQLKASGTFDILDPEERRSRAFRALDQVDQLRRGKVVAAAKTAATFLLLLTLGIGAAACAAFTAAAGEPANPPVATATPCTDLLQRPGKSDQYSFTWPADASRSQLDYITVEVDGRMITYTFRNPATEVSAP